jgi:hypothetical protein
MTQNHYIAIGFAAGVLAGFFLLTKGNTYGSGKWGNSTFGWVYVQTAQLAAP